MARITRVHIDAEFNKMMLAAVRLGIKTRAETWIISTGSVRHKEPWRLFYEDKSKARVPVTFLPDGIVGSNGTETLYTLRTIRRAWEYAYAAKMK